MQPEHLKSKYDKYRKENYRSTSFNSILAKSPNQIKILII